MRNVRWAHAALLAVVLPACAHGGSNENVENPSSEDSPPSVQQQPADREWVLAQGGEVDTNSSKTFRQRLRPVFLAAGTSDVNTTYAVKSSVEVNAPSCHPWSGDNEGRCDLSEMVTDSMR